MKLESSQNEVEARPLVLAIELAHHLEERGTSSEDLTRQRGFANYSIEFHFVERLIESDQSLFEN